MRSWFYICCAMLTGPFTLPFLWANPRRSMFHKICMTAVVFVVWGFLVYAVHTRAAVLAKGVL
jgi:hypothetical protein